MICFVSSSASAAVLRPSARRRPRPCRDHRRTGSSVTASSSRASTACRLPLNPSRPAFIAAIRPSSVRHDGAASAMRAHAASAASVVSMVASAGNPSAATALDHSRCQPPVAAAAAMDCRTGQPLLRVRCVRLRMPCSVTLASSAMQAALAWSSRAPRVSCGAAQRAAALSARPGHGRAAPRGRCIADALPQPPRQGGAPPPGRGTIRHRGRRQRLHAAGGSKRAPRSLGLSGRLLGSSKCGRGRSHGALAARVRGGWSRTGNQRPAAPHRRAGRQARRLGRAVSRRRRAEPAGSPSSPSPAGTGPPSCMRRITPESIARRPRRSHGVRCRGTISPRDSRDISSSRSAITVARSATSPALWQADASCMEMRRDRLHLCGERQRAGQEVASGRHATTAAWRVRQWHYVLGVGQRAPRPGKVGIKRPSPPRRWSGAATPTRRTGRPRQRLFSDRVAGDRPPSLACRFGLGGQRGVRGDQTPHRPKNGRGRQRVARRLGAPAGEAKLCEWPPPPLPVFVAFACTWQVIRRSAARSRAAPPGINGVLHREYQRILRQRRVSGGQPLDFDCLALTVSGGAWKVRRPAPGTDFRHWAADAGRPPAVRGLRVPR